MNKLLPGIIRVIALFALLSVIPLGKVFAAASLQLSPTSSSATQNSTFTLTLTINTDNNSVTGSDVTLQYAPAGVEFVSASNGNFFPNLIPTNDSSTGKLVLHGYVTSLADAKSGTGTMATIVFKVKQSSGVSNVSFVCTNGGTDTTMIASSGQNILNCANINSATITYGNAILTPTPTPGNAPQGYTPVCIVLSSDSSQATGTPATFSFSCSGSDQSGLIMASTFDFGDGTVDTINNNVGSPGTITTKHTYTSIGTFRATCRLRDNDNMWSSIPYACTKLISINPNPVTRVVYRTTSAQTNATNIGTPTPTLDVVSLTYPTITPIPTAEPTVTPTETSESSIPWFWIIAVLAVIVGAFLTLKGRRPPTPPGSSHQPPQAAPTVSTPYP